MGLWERLRYAFVAAILAWMAIAMPLMLLSADGVEIVPHSWVNALFFDDGGNIVFFLILYGVACWLAPVLHERFPVEREWQRQWGKHRKP